MTRKNSKHSTTTPAISLHSIIFVNDKKISANWSLSVELLFIDLIHLLLNLTFQTVKVSWENGKSFNWKKISVLNTVIVIKKRKVFPFLMTMICKSILSIWKKYLFLATYSFVLHDFQYKPSVKIPFVFEVFDFDSKYLFFLFRWLIVFDVSG